MSIPPQPLHPRGPIPPQVREGKSDGPRKQLLRACPTTLTWQRAPCHQEELYLLLHLPLLFLQLPLDLLQSHLPPLHLPFMEASQVLPKHREQSKPSASSDPVPHSLCHLAPLVTSPPPLLIKSHHQPRRRASRSLLLLLPTHG